MRHLILIILWLFTAICYADGVANLPKQQADNINKLLRYYPAISHYADNKLFFRDGSSLPYDDLAPAKSHQQLLASPSIKDQFFYHYDTKQNVPAKNQDAGRIRNLDFFKKIYGKTAQEVKANLVTITWCPKLVGQKLQVTKINDVHLKLQAISAELDKHPEWLDYIKNVGGTFNWRYISGSKNLSPHSFGMTIDINTKYSNYWQWDSKSKKEAVNLKYKNKIPLGIVEIFERHGFIWGGRWYHYDTMHFEYRPELVF